MALFYSSKAEQFACTVPFIKIGLERNERCLYIADDNSAPMVWRRLQEAGIDVDRAQKEDSLRVVTKQETYLRHGVFEPQRMVAELQREVDFSLSSGFAAFRATGEMTWALDMPSSLIRLIDYEAKLNSQFPPRFIGLCQYDESRFPSHVISEMIQLHPKIIARGQLIENGYYRPHLDSDDRRKQQVNVDQLLAA